MWRWRGRGRLSMVQHVHCNDVRDWIIYVRKRSEKQEIIRFCSRLTGRRVIRIQTYPIAFLKPLNSAL